MTKINLFPLHHYNDAGDLKPPLFFYLCLLFLSRTWVLLLLCVASSETGNKMLSFFYPDINHFYLGLTSGFIALALFFIAGRCFAEKSDKSPFFCLLWTKGAVFLLFSILLDLSLQLYYLSAKQFHYSLSASLQLVLIIWCLLYLLRSRHLRMSFTTH